ncbi:MAG TPA: patatin-like phospholipase family protein [Candidatus Polarisedimenticolia bacterium]|jgi:NTE family protein|nr:patatin-like phospholipase family protein [Candidatus Polarisedimenticolia bacterium]
MRHAAGFTPGITLVLGAGGARGVAHAAVLRGLRREGIPIDAILGCSVGAIVGGMYAAVGMEPDDMLQASHRLTAGSLLAFALSRWRVPGVSAAAGRRAGAIPEYLARLDAASFETLHHGVRRLGILTFDMVRREEVLALGGPGLPAPLPLASAVKASAAIPVLFPPLRADIGGRRRYLADAGWFTAVPVERAFAPPLRSRRVIAVDLSLLVCPRQARRSYWQRLQESCGDRLLVLRPNVRGCGTIFSRSGDPARLAEAGEAAVAGALGVLRAWRVPATPAPTRVP